MAMTTNKEAAMRIRDLREDHDLTQEEVATYLHIKQNTYSQYENGQRQLPIACLMALAKLYKTSTDYILGLTDEQSSSGRAGLDAENDA